MLLKELEVLCWQFHLHVIFSRSMECCIDKDVTKTPVTSQRLFSREITLFVAYANFRLKDANFNQLSYSTTDYKNDLFKIVQLCIIVISSLFWVPFEFCSSLVWVSFEFLSSLVRVQFKSRSSFVRAPFESHLSPVRFPFESCSILLRVSFESCSSTYHFSVSTLKF